MAVVRLSMPQTREIGAKLAGTRRRYELALGKNVLVAVDSFFPAAILERIKDADETDDKKLIAKTRQDLADAVDDKAASISEKYIEPPKTTPFGVMYLPTESLFYEVLAHNG